MRRAVYIAPVKIVLFPALDPSLTSRGWPVTVISISNYLFSNQTYIVGVAGDHGCVRVIQGPNLIRVCDLIMISATTNYLPILRAHVYVYLTA